MSQTEMTASLLTKIPFFQSLSDDARLALARLFCRRSHERGEVIVHYGDAGHAFFILTEGSVKVTRPLETGGEVVMDVLDAGEFFGEMALLDGSPRSASIYALEFTNVLVLTRRDFLDFLQSHPDVTYELIVVLAERVRHLNDRLEDMIGRNLPGRLARRLSNWIETRGRHTSEGIVLRVPLTQAELAGMVGSSRQRLNLLLGEWQDAGIIRLARRNEIIIVKPDELQALGG